MSEEWDSKKRNINQPCSRVGVRTRRFGQKVNLVTYFESRKISRPWRVGATRGSRVVTFLYPVLRHYFQYWSFVFSKGIWSSRRTSGTYILRVQLSASGNLCGQGEVLGRAIHLIDWGIHFQKHQKLRAKHAFRKDGCTSIICLGTCNKVGV